MVNRSMLMADTVQTSKTEQPKVMQESMKNIYCLTEGDSSSVRDSSQ